jgi:signal transduction histidine kinase/ActR/RegA family two-component response regulator
MKRSAGFAARIGSPFDRPAAFIVELCVIGAAYYGLAKGGLALASLHPSATPIWPPTGFALAVVLLRGYRVWPAIFLAALIANATTAGSLATSVAIGAGNALEGVVGAFLVNRWSNGRDTFATPAGIARFSLLSFVPTAMCATIGVGSLAAAGFADGTNVGSIWLTWWLGDLAGALVITPVLVLWVTGSSAWWRRDLAERAAVLAGACAVGLIAFSPLVEQTAHTAPLGFLAVVPLLWSALRLAPRDTATVALVLSGFAVWGTLAGGGPFARANLNDSFLLLLMFMIATTVPSLVLSAEVAVRKRTDEDLRQAQAEAALLESQERLAQAQKMEAIGQLTGGIAHDFNNILMIVSGHAEMLRRRVAEPKALRGLDAIERAIRRGENLTRQLLTFARRQPLSAAVVDLKERIEAVRDMLGSSLRGNIALVVNVPADTWPVEIDVAEFELALLNVAVNARDAMAEGGTLSVAARNVGGVPGRTEGPLAGDCVELTLGDTGAGIPPDVLPRIFDPFFTTKAVGKGTGLGLSQVYGFVRQSGGAIAAKSELGRGSTITMWLPRSRAAKSSKPEARETTGTASVGGTILVVEDNREVADVTMTLLEQLGYRVLRAENAADALETLRGSATIDLVFSDIVMPGGMNGIHLAQEVSEHHPAIRVLLTTGYSDMAAAAETRYRILRKPFEVPGLERAVRDAMTAPSGSAGRRFAGGSTS